MQRAEEEIDERSSILPTMRRTLFALPLFACSAVALCQNQFTGEDQFPQFRSLSGLSGGGYGLNYKGWGSTSGATAYSTPIGYALGRDQFRVSGVETAFKLHPINDQTSTGKASFMFGHTFGERVNLAYSYFVKSNHGDASTNLQLQLIPNHPQDPSFSIGVQDIGGHGGSAGEGAPTDKRSSRSFFGVVTTPVPTTPGGKPLYISGGWGTRRFGKGFASASYQLATPLRIWAEYDGFGVNEGILLTYRPNGTDEEGNDKRAFEANLLLGLAKSKWPTLAITLGF